MHLIAKLFQRRWLPVIVASSLATLALLAAWLSPRPLPKKALPSHPSLSSLIHSPPVSHFPPLIYPIPDPIPPPLHSNSRLLPFQYWNHRAMYPERYTVNSCMNLPSVSDLQYAAYSWQLLQVGTGSVYVYGAYYDKRFEEPLVRILIYTDVAPVPKLLCQLWFLDDNEPQTELAEPLFAWRSNWGGPSDGINEPYVLSCRCRRHPPEKNMAPAAVSVVTAPCGVATNVLNVQVAPINDPLSLQNEVTSSRNGTSVAVCLKWLHYRNDVSAEVIEWLQLVKHFGAQKVFIDIVRVHPNTRKVLKYYEDEGFVVITELSHPPQVSRLLPSNKVIDFVDYRRELLPLNDCLYRSVGQYDWISSLDLDEIIVPPPGTTWADLIDNEVFIASSEPDGKPIDALVFPNYYVLDEAQKDLAAPAKTRILAHTWRSRTPNPPGFNVKSFFNVSSVTTMHNHTPLSCHGVLGGCKKRYLNNGLGRMLHFRKKCPFDSKNYKQLHDVVREDILDGWREPVLAEVRAILEKLGLEGLK